MILVRQPKGSNLCGQACVASLAEITLPEAIAACGTSGKTKTHHIRTALSKYNIWVGWRRQRGWPPEYAVSMLNWISHDGQLRHWTIYREGKHYDPAAGKFRKPPRYLTEHGRVISHLRIFLPCID